MMKANNYLYVVLLRLEIENQWRRCVMKKGFQKLESSSRSGAFLKESSGLILNLKNLWPRFGSTIGGN